MDGDSARDSWSRDCRGRLNVNAMATPDCRAARSVMGVGTTGCLAVGSPGAAHPNARHPQAKRKKVMVAVARGVITALQNITAEVLILYNLGKLLGDVRSVHLHVLFLEFRRLE